MTSKRDDHTGALMCTHSPPCTWGHAQEYWAVDAELWRADKRTRWLKMLRRLVCSMDWTTALISGVTLAQLARAAGFPDSPSMTSSGANTRPQSRHPTCHNISSTVPAAVCGFRLRVRLPLRAKSSAISQHGQANGASHP